MPRRSSATSIVAVSRPSTEIVPEVGLIIRLTMRSDVVLPQPEGPTRTVIWPVGASSVRLSTATHRRRARPPLASGSREPLGASPYRLVTPSKRIMQINVPARADTVSVVQPRVALL